MFARSMHSPSGNLDGSANARICHAAADIPGHNSVNVAIARIGIVLEQSGGLHDLAGLTVSALRNLQFEPRGLQWMLAGWVQSLDSRHLCPGNRPNPGYARTRGTSFDMHSAGATKTNSASELRAR
jgi:hypothetical protein